MASFSVRGMDELITDLRQLAEIPDSVHDEMLYAAAHVVVPVQKATIKAYGIYDGSSPKHVADSIKAGKVKFDKHGNRVLYISPTGTRRRGKTTTRNAEILFVNEYGRKNMRARPAIRDANEAAADRAVAAQAEVLDRYYQSKNL